MSAIPLSLSGEIPELLRRFACTEGLSMDDLVVLASRCSVQHLPAGQRLFGEGDDAPGVILLLDGALQLATADGQAHRLEAGTPAADVPIAACRRPGMDTRTATPVTLLRIDDAGLGDWPGTFVATAASGGVSPLAGLGVLSEEFGTLDFGDPGALTGHRMRIATGELALPSLPAVALEASRLIDRDDASAAAVAGVLVQDPAIAIKLMRAANSPLFYGRVAVDSCERAVLRLGLRTTRQLVIAFAVRDVFRGGQPVLQGLAERLWSHSTSVAALSFVLARRLGAFDAEDAQLAGLLHDIGAVPVLGYAAGEPSLHNDPRSVATLAASLRVPLGRRLLEGWGLEAGLVTAATHAEDWWREHDGAADLADLVLVAQHLELHAAGCACHLPPLPQLPAFGRLCGNVMNADDLLALMTEADEQLHEVRSLLHA